MSLAEFWGIMFAATLCGTITWSCFGELFCREFDHHKLHLTVIGLFCAFTVILIIYGNFIA